MAGSYTEHYQLSQWQPQDRVLRTEFNQDNAKLDGALHALAESQGRAAPKLLQEVLQLPQGSTYFLNLTGIDWSGWREVWVDMDLSTDKSCVVYIAAVPTGWGRRNRRYLRGNRMGCVG